MCLETAWVIGDPMLLLSQWTACINTSELGSLSFASTTQCHGHENCILIQVIVEFAPLAVLMG